MKTFSLITIFLFCCSLAKTQTTQQAAGTIDVQGFAKTLIVPEGYKIQFLIQEEEVRAQGYQIIGKLSIDSVKQTFFAALSKFKINEGSLKLIAISSKETGQYPNSFVNMAYEYVTKNRDEAQRLVNELRSPGLKGVYVRNAYSAVAEKVEVALYDSAVKDAKRIATELAYKSGRAIGELRNIEVRDAYITTLRREADNYGDIYSGYAVARFEIDLRDKYATCIVKAGFELK